MNSKSSEQGWEYEGYGSRFRLKGTKHAVTVVLGWDDPLQTYFAQVWESGAGGDCNEPQDPLLWAGCSWQELPELDSLARVLANFAAIPDDLRTCLLADRLSGVAGRR